MYKLLCTFLLTFLLAFQALAESMPVPAKLQAALFMKILAYDRKIKGDFKVAILNGGSKGEVDQAFQSLSGQKINGGTLSLTHVTLADLSSLKSKGVGVLYITPDNSANISSIIKATRSSGILTITGVPDYVNDGVSVGIGLKGSKPDIIVNLSASKSESRDFSSQLLKLCTIVK